jgi:hypothetical protein
MHCGIELDSNYRINETQHWLKHAKWPNPISKCVVKILLQPLIILRDGIYLHISLFLDGSQLNIATH